MPWFSTNGENPFSTKGEAEFRCDFWMLYIPVWDGGLSRFAWFCCKFLELEFEIL
jgi:hypothetical protein